MNLISLAKELQAVKSKLNLYWKKRFVDWDIVEYNWRGNKDILGFSIQTPVQARLQLDQTNYLQVQ